MLRRRLRAGRGAVRRLSLISCRLRAGLKRRQALLCKLALGAGVIAGVAALAGGGLWWRLSSGPIALDLVTPWFTSAMERNFAGRYRIEVGGTVLERDGKGGVALRLRDIVVHDAGGELIARAPRAEIGVSSMSLLVGNPRVTRFLLVDANMDIRIEADGRVEVFAGGRRPFLALTPTGDAPQAAPLPAPERNALAALAKRGIEDNVAALMRWVDSFGALGRNGAVSITGFDGRDLIEVGVKNGRFNVDDARNGRQWTFAEMTLSLTRPAHGGVAVHVGSESDERRWSLNAALTPLRDGRRLLRFETKQVTLDDLLLVLQLGDGQFHSNLPISAEVRAELSTDGTPQLLKGHVVATGSIGEEQDPDDRITIDLVEFRLDWDIARRTLLVPFQLISGGNRVTLFAQLAPPLQRDGSWITTLHGGSIVLGPLAQEKDALVLKRVAVRLRHDLTRQRIELEQADFSTGEAKNVGLALSGNLDYSGAEPRLTLGLAGTQMSVSALKRLWPAFVAPNVRTWVMQHLYSGVVGHIDVAVNAPLPTLSASGPPLPDDGLAVDFAIKGAVLRPVDGLPLIRDADLVARVSGRKALVTLGRGTVEVSPGRLLTIANGAFEVPDMRPKAPPARVRFRLDGPVAAAAELVANERLRDFSGVRFDPVTSRGTVTAQVVLGLPLQADLPKEAVSYNVAADLTNFAAERMILGQRVEAALLRVAASNQAYQVKGDVRINGIPTHLEYRRAAGEAEAEVRIQAALDEAMRARFGFDSGGAVSGLTPIKLAGRIAANDSQFSVEADLTAAKIDNLFPGWIKPAGRPMRVSFVLINREKSTRIDDIVLDGSGATVRGSIEIDAHNELLSANFPVFALADGDKATLRAERGPDGALRVTLRGDVFDGRTFVKTSIAGAQPDPKRKAQRDLDLDIKLGAVLGHHGETLRAVDLRLSRRGGQIRSFSLNAKLGRDMLLRGELREVRAARAGGPARWRSSGHLLHFDTGDAGALLRFTDTYPRMSGGRLLALMEPPTSDFAPQEGILSVRDFTIRGEPGLDGVLANVQRPARDHVEFSYLHAEFTRSPGKFVIHDGVVRGPIIGATIDGNIDYQRDEVRLRGTFVPLYGLNNVFSQIPIIGFFLGGPNTNEGLLGVTYEVVGSPGQPLLRVNPASVLAPGLLRKFFEFPSANEGARALPQQLAR